MTGSAWDKSMADFRWRKKYELGMAAFDKPHRRLLALAGEVAQRVRARAPAEEVAASVRALADFTAAHFAEEERLMAASGYRENAVHAEQHGELLGQLERFARRLISHKKHPHDSAKTLAFLRDWVALHIMHSDRKLADHLSSQRLPPA